MIDLEGLGDVFRVDPTGAESSREVPAAQPGTAATTDLACPPLLPPVPDWHPHPWAVTAWGGQMIDAAFGDTFLFKGRMRPEAVLGIGLQKRILRAGPLALELEADLFSHIAKQQPGGSSTRRRPTPTFQPRVSVKAWWESAPASGFSRG